MPTLRARRAAHETRELLSEADASGRCATCGRPLDTHDTHIRLKLPDPVIAIPEEDRREKTWGGDPLLQVAGAGSFVRVLLPVRLTGGHRLTIGTWLSVGPAELHEIWAMWETERYAGLHLAGFLANAIEPWGDAVLAAPAKAAVVASDQLPVIHYSDHELLTRIIQEEWPHDLVLSAYTAILDAPRAT